MENIIISTEICETCAECCKRFPFVKVSKNEIKELVQISGLHFEVFAYPIGNAVDDYFMLFHENGGCIFLNEKNGIYFCGVYEARPETCRNYPLGHRQKEVCKADRESFLENI